MRICHQILGERVVRQNLLLYFFLKELTGAWSSCTEGRVRKQSLGTIIWRGKNQTNNRFSSLEFDKVGTSQK